MIRAIFFDIDGTLVSHETKRVPESAKEAVRQLREKGIKVFTCSGRHVAEFRNLPLEGLEFDGYILLNGQMYLDENKQYLGGRGFTPEATRSLVTLFNEKNEPLVLVNAQGHYMNFISSKVKVALKEVSTPIPQIKEYEGEELFQATAFYTKEEEHRLLEVLHSDLKLARWSDKGVDIISAYGGKASGMKFFMEKLGISREETMAFGDAHNDLDMIDYAGVGVVMGNGCEELKERGDYITASVEEEGIRKALEYFHLL